MSHIDPAIDHLFLPSPEEQRLAHRTDATRDALCPAARAWYDAHKPQSGAMIRGVCRLFPDRAPQELAARLNTRIALIDRPRIVLPHDDVLSRLADDTEPMLSAERDTRDWPDEAPTEPHATCDTEPPGAP